MSNGVDNPCTAETRNGGMGKDIESEFNQELGENSRNRNSHKKRKSKMMLSRNRSRIKPRSKSEVRDEGGGSGVVGGDECGYDGGGRDTFFFEKSIRSSYPDMHKKY